MKEINVLGIPDTFSIPSGMHTSLPLRIIPGSELRAGNRILSSTPARIVFAGSPEHEVSPAQISEEIAKLKEAREHYAAIWDAFKRSTKEWFAAMNAEIAAHLSAKPERRKIKQVRRITRAEGRAMALDVGFDPSLHGYYHSDPVDEMNANTELESALRVWRKEKSAMEEAYAQANPHPVVPDVPAPPCDAIIVSRYAHLFGY